jgi:K+-transporting ATPase ATPase C chain
MMPILRPALASLLVLTLLTGVAYPLVVTGLARVFFPWQAAGSILYRDGRPAGSALVGQPFRAPKYFWGRLSATSPTAYNGGASSGSNLGPGNPALVAAAEARLADLRAAAPSLSGLVPADLVTASASGLDPHVSPAAAEVQISRVAKARGLEPGAVRALVERFTLGRQLGFLGEARVDVLGLNLTLDSLEPPPPR